MLIQTNTTDNQNLIGAAADMRSEGVNEVFAIGNMLYIESVLIENSSAHYRRTGKPLRNARLHFKRENN